MDGPLAGLKSYFFLCPDVAMSLPCWLSQFRPILFLYYEEILVSSNLNSNLLRFHCAYPSVSTWHQKSLRLMPAVFYVTLFE